MTKETSTKLTRIWKDHSIGEEPKMRLIQPLVFIIVTYGSKSWTIKATCKNRIEGFEMIDYRRKLRIP